MKRLFKTLGLLVALLLLTLTLLALASLTYNSYAVDVGRPEVIREIPVQEPTRTASIIFAQGLVGLALLNIVGCHVLGCKRKGGQPSAGAYGPPPAAQP